MARQARVPRTEMIQHRATIHKYPHSDCGRLSLPSSQSNISGPVGVSPLTLDRQSMASQSNLTQINLIQSGSKMGHLFSKKYQDTPPPTKTGISALNWGTNSNASSTTSTYTQKSVGGHSHTSAGTGTGSLESREWFH